MGLKKAEIAQKKKDAKMLITQKGITQEKAAKLVGVSTTTISKWAREGKWDKLKIGYLQTREEQVQALLDELTELNLSIKSRPEGERFASSKEADARKKITSSIKDLESEVADLPTNIGVVQRMLLYYRSLGKLTDDMPFEDFCDRYIKSIMG